MDSEEIVARVMRELATIVRNLDVDYSSHEVTEQQLKEILNGLAGALAVRADEIHPGAIDARVEYQDERGEWVTLGGKDDD